MALDINVLYESDADTTANELVLNSFNSDISAAYSSTGIYMETGSTNPNPAPVPEPSTLLLLSAGLGGLALYRRKTKK